MTPAKQKKAAARRKDYKRRANINKYQPKVHTEEKVERYRPVRDRNGWPVTDKQGNPKLEHIGYKIFVKKEYKTKPAEPPVVGRVRVLAIGYPKSRKFIQQERKLVRLTK